MSERVVLVAFNGDEMCFVHVLLHALDLDRHGVHVRVIVEGTATKTIHELNDEAKPFGKLYIKVRDAGLIDCVCEACAAKMGVLESIKAQGLRLGNDMNGHPSLAQAIGRGDRVITF